MISGNDISNIISAQSTQMSAAFQNSVNLASFAEGGQQVPASSPTQMPSMPVTLSTAPFPQPQFQTMASRASARYFGSAGTYSPMFSPMQVQEMVEREDARRRETWMVGGITNFAAPVAAMGTEFAAGGALGSALYQRGLQKWMTANVPGSQFTGKMGLKGLASFGGRGAAMGAARGAMLGGAVGFALPAAALSIVYSGAEHVWEMHQQNRMAEDILGGNEWRLGNIEGPSNRGAQIAGGMRKFARQTKAGGGMKMNVDELMEMLQFGVEAGMFDMNRSFSDLERKMTQAFEASRNIARALKTTVQGGMQMLNELQQMGFYDTSAAAQQAYNITGMAGAAGMAPGQMFGMMGMGAQMARGMGLRGAAGATAAGGITTALRVGMREGLVGRGTVGELGGIEATTQTVLGASAAFAQGPIGMGMMAAFGRGGFDSGAFNRFAGGQMGLGEMMSGMGGLSRGEAVGLASPFSQQRMSEQIMQRGPEGMVAFGAQLLERVNLDVNMDNLALAVSNLPGAQGMDANQLRALIESGISAPRGGREAAVETAMQRVRVAQAEKRATTERPGSALAFVRMYPRGLEVAGELFEQGAGAALEEVSEYSRGIGASWKRFRRGVGQALGGVYTSDMALVGKTSFGLESSYLRMTKEEMIGAAGGWIPSVEYAERKSKADIDAFSRRNNLTGSQGWQSSLSRLKDVATEKGSPAEVVRGVLKQIKQRKPDDRGGLEGALTSALEGFGGINNPRGMAKVLIRDSTMIDDLDRNNTIVGVAQANEQRTESFRASIGMTPGESYEIAGVSRGAIPVNILRALKEGSEATARELSGMTSTEVRTLATEAGDTGVGRMFAAVAGELEAAEAGKKGRSAQRLEGAVTSQMGIDEKVSPYEGIASWEQGVTKQDTMNVRTIYVGKIEKDPSLTSESG